MGRLQGRHCNSLRATSATLLLDSGAAIEAVQDLLDHKHITTTQIYDKRRRAIVRFSVHTITAWAAQWQESGGMPGIPAFKMGRSRRFDRQQSQAYIDSKRLPLQPVGPKTAPA